MHRRPTLRARGGNLGPPAGVRSDQGVGPAQTREAGEVVVAGAELSSVLNGDGGQMGVVGQVPGRARRAQERAEHNLVAFGRGQHGGAGLGEPAVDQVEGLVHNGAVAGTRWPSCSPARRRGARSKPAPPSPHLRTRAQARPGLERASAILIDGVEQQVGVDQLHFRRWSLRTISASSSSAASRSA